MNELSLRFFPDKSVIRLFNNLSRITEKPADQPCKLRKPPSRWLCKITAQLFHLMKTFILYKKQPARNIKLKFYEQYYNNGTWFRLSIKFYNLG